MIIMRFRHNFKIHRIMKTHILPLVILLVAIALNARPSVPGARLFDDYPVFIQQADNSGRREFRFLYPV